MSINKNRKFKFYADPSHGWLSVPLHYLIDLKITRLISSCSYISDSFKTVYLEEDIDAPLFIGAMNRKYGENWSINIRYFQAEKPSSIRQKRSIHHIWPFPVELSATEQQEKQEILESFRLTCAKKESENVNN